MTDDDITINLPEGVLPDITTGKHDPARLLADMAEALATSAGVTTDQVVIGPVDFGAAEDGTT